MQASASGVFECDGVAMHLLKRLSSTAVDLEGKKIMKKKRGKYMSPWSPFMRYYIGNDLDLASWHTTPTPNFLRSLQSWALRFARCAQLYEIDILETKQ